MSFSQDTFVTTKQENMNPSHTSFSEKSKELLFVLTPPTPLQETVQSL